MLKKVLSMVLSVSMLMSVIVTSTVAVSAEGTVDVPSGYLISEDSFVDDLEDLSKVYNTNAKDPNGWHFEKVSGSYNVESGYKVCYTGQTWRPDYQYMEYKSESGRKITKATFTVSMNVDEFANGIVPSVKIDGGKTANAGLWVQTVKGIGATGWNSTVTATYIFEEGTDSVQLHFKGVSANATILDKVEISTTTEAIESVKYGEIMYDDCHSLDNMFASKKLEVIDETAYNNGGQMIGMTESYADYYAVYKIPEGRTFNEMWIEYSDQDNKLKPLVAYSTNGATWTTVDVTWTDGAKCSSEGNAQWATKRTTTMTLPEAVDASEVRFVKIYANNTSNDDKPQRYQFYLRKVEIFTGGAEISESSVTDSMSGSNGFIYELSNIDRYENVNASEAELLKDTTNLTYPDNDILALKAYSKEGYIIYKAAEGRAFTGVTVKSYERDNGVSPEVYALRKGSNEYTQLTMTSSTIGRVGSEANKDVNSAIWNALKTQTASPERSDAYTAIKVVIPAQGASNRVKLSEIKLATKKDLENTFVSAGFEETFENMDNTIDAVGFTQPGWDNTTAFVVTDKAPVTDPYVMYQAEPGKSMGVAEIVFTQMDYSDTCASVELSDAEGNGVEWSYTKTVNTYQGTNQFTDITFTGEIPSDAKYIILKTTLVGDGWKSRITKVKFSKAAELYQKADETETKLDALKSGNVFGKVYCTNDTDADKTVWVIGVVKEDGVVTSAAVNPTTLEANKQGWLSTPEITVGTVGSKTTLEVFVFDVTNGGMTPMRAEKAVFTK